MEEHLKQIQLLLYLKDAVYHLSQTVSLDSVTVEFIAFDALWLHVFWFSLDPCSPDFIAPVPGLL